MGAAAAFAAGAFSAGFFGAVGFSAGFTTAGLGSSGCVGEVLGPVVSAGRAVAACSAPFGVFFFLPMKQRLSRYGPPFYGYGLS